MTPTTPRSLAFPISALPPEELAPPLNPEHPSWDTIAPWTDPLADRGAYRVESRKSRVDDEHGAAIRFEENRLGGRALVAETPALRDAILTCKLRATQVGIAGSYDGLNQFSARAGLIFRMETIRRHYFFCIEDAVRLVLYRRIDDDWHVLDWRRVDLPSAPVTLRVDLAGDTLGVACPELDVEMSAVDTCFARGKAGFRSIGEALLYELRIETDAEQHAESEAAARTRHTATERLGREIPDAVSAGEWSIENAHPVLCNNFVDPDRNDLLWATPDGIEARTWEGDVLWRSPVKPAAQELGLAGPDGSRRLYLLAGERDRQELMSVTGRMGRRIVAEDILVLDGRTGEPVVRVPLPDDPPGPGQLSRYDFSFENGFARDAGSPDFLIRQWRRGLGDGGLDIWAYDRNANLLWQRRNETIYGHHNAVHWADVNRDGRPEVLAGGTCLSADGDLLWTHDQADEMRRYPGAGHYDAVLVQPAGTRPPTPPPAFLLGGSAGVYVVDATRGRTLATHRVGHAQWGMWCNLRPDLPGMECMVGTRWANYGILTLFSAAGEKLWSIQPDYVLQGSRAVQWTRTGSQHVWINTSAHGMGLYDGHGRLVKPLMALRAAFAGKTRLRMPALAFERRPGGRHWLALESGDTLKFFKPEDDE